MVKYDDSLRDDLKNYVDRELSKGHSLEEIKKVLLDVGHHPGEVRKSTKSDYIYTLTALMVIWNTLSDSYEPLVRKEKDNE